MLQRLTTAVPSATVMNLYRLSEASGAVVMTLGAPTSRRPCAPSGGHFRACRSRLRMPTGRKSSPAGPESSCSGPFRSWRATTACRRRLPRPSAATEGCTPVTWPGGRRRFHHPARPGQGHIRPRWIQHLSDRGRQRAGEASPGRRGGRHRRIRSRARSRSASCVDHPDELGNVGADPRHVRESFGGA